MPIWEQAYRLWTRHWWRLVSMQILTLLTMRFVGAALFFVLTGESGTWKGSFLDFRTFDPMAPPNQPFSEPALVVLVISILLYVIGQAGLMGLLKPIVIEARSPGICDACKGVRKFSLRLLGVSFLSALVIAMVAFLAVSIAVLGQMASTLWLGLLMGIATFFPVAAALLYSQTALVVEDTTAWDALGLSMRLLQIKWHEPVSAAIVLMPLSLMAGGVVLLSETVLREFTPLLDLAMQSLTIPCFALYIMVRYIRNARPLLSPDGAPDTDGLTPPEMG